MSGFVLYFIESSLLLAAFYSIYAVGLRRETFFRLNRFVLLAIPVLSLILPLVQFEFNGLQPNTLDQPLTNIANLSRSYYDLMASWESEVGQGTSASPTGLIAFPWQSVLIYTVLALYMAGVILCLSRTAWSIRWIIKTIRDYSSVEKDGVKIVKLPHPTAPFSFLNFVFVHAPVADTDDFGQILDHERTHIEERHTLDLLYVKLVAAFLWFNPLIWQLLKSLKTTHEYIADRKIIQSGYSVAAYQTLLLRQLISNNSYGLVHNFNLSFIKKRITMMTNKQSGWMGRTKAALAIAAVFCFSAVMTQCNSKIDEQLTPALTVAPGASSDVDVPVLPSSTFRFKGDITESLTFTISNNTLRIGDKLSSVEEINHIQDEDYGRKSPIIMMVDQNQPMGFVREVEMALRKADRRKLLYIGKTSSGDRVDVTLVLPPYPKTALDGDVSQVPDEYLLKIDLGKNEGALNQKKVYDFVTGFVERGTAERAVVSAFADNDVTYGVYLSNFFYVKEGYVQLYQERAHKMFGKDFYQTSEDEYKAVREKIPTNISIAED